MKIKKIWISISLLLMISQYSFAEITLNDVEYPLDATSYLKQFITNEDTYTDVSFYLIDEYTKEGHYDRAFHIINQLPTSLIYLKKPLYTNLFISLYVSNSIDSVFKYMNKLETSLKPYILEQCFTKSIELKQFNDAQNILKQVDSVIIFSRMTSQLITTYIKQNNISQAQALLKTITFPAEKQQSEFNIGIALLNQGKNDMINNFLKSIKETDTLNIYLTQIVANLSANNNIVLAQEYLTQITNDNNYEKALITIIEALCLNLELEQALSYTQSITNEDLRQSLLVNFGVGFAKIGNFELINNLFDKIKTDAIKNEFLINVSEVLIQQQYLEESFQYFMKLPLDKQKIYGHRIVEHLHKLDNYHFNMLILKKVQDTELLDILLSTYTINLAKTNQTKYIIETLDQVTSSELKTDTIFTILSIPTLTNKELYTSYLNNDLLYKYAIHINSDSSDLLDKDKLYFIDEALKIPAISSIEMVELRLFKIDLLTKLNQQKSAKTLLRKVRRQLKELYYQFDFGILSVYTTCELSIGSQKKLFNVFKKYEPKSDILFLFHYYPSTISKSDLKQLKKNIQSLANSMN